MLQLIQQQGQRIDQVAHLVSLAQNQASDGVAQPVALDSPGNVAAKRPLAKLPDPEKFTGVDLSLLAQFLGKLQAKLEVDAIAIDVETDHNWAGWGTAKPTQTILSNE
ncbi:hypothetical protein V1509DRAFT_613572 [Lipomyces kononenkoae]